MKKCFKCKKEKPLTEFYKHKQMSDGYLNKCKSCTKKDSSKNRKQNIEYYREYDRKRGNRSKPYYTKEYRKKFPNKAKSHDIVTYAIKTKRLHKEPCEVCGKYDFVHAHHDDYLKPLNVRWLCPAHHRQWHEENGEGLNP